MDRLRAALLGCLLTGGVIFGARPVLPEQRFVRPIVYAAGPGPGLGRTSDQLARWFQPVQAGAVLNAPGFTGPGTDHQPRTRRRRCSSARLRHHRQR